MKNKNIHIVQNENCELISLLKCISATNCFLPPFIMFKAKQHKQVWKNNLQNKSIITFSDNEWTNNTFFINWLTEIFKPHTKSVYDNWYCFILNGHASHCTTETITFAIKHQIMLLCLSSHIIHLLQSLNVEVFNLLTTVYTNLLTECTRLEKFIKIDKLNFLLLYQAAHKKVTDINIQHA